MEKIRVYELAKRLGITKEEAVERLRARGLEIKTSLSIVEPDALDDEFPATAAEASPAKTRRKQPALKAGSLRSAASSPIRKVATTRVAKPRSRGLSPQRVGAGASKRIRASVTPVRPGITALRRSAAAALGAARSRTGVKTLRAPDTRTAAAGTKRPTTATASPSKSAAAPTTVASTARRVATPTAGKAGGPLRPVRGAPAARSPAGERTSGPGITRPAVTVALRTPARAGTARPASAPLVAGARSVSPAAPGKAATPAALRPPQTAPRVTPPPAARRRPAMAPLLRTRVPTAFPGARTSRPMAPPARRPPARRSTPAATAAATRTPAPPRPKIAPPPVPTGPMRSITISEGATLKELSEKTGVKSKDLIRTLMLRGILVTINQTLEPKVATELCQQFNCEARVVSFEEEAVEHNVEEDTRSGRTIHRPPVVTIMGHVDHGKTTLLDAIRESNIVEHEHGGITQHIGAYRVDIRNRSIVFLDTPGHEAFTKMRARGAQVTDIVLLVVASDDGVQPQTVEAIHHARAAKVPIIVAINKIDKPGSNPDRIKQALSERELMTRDWGGETEAVPISAKQRKGLEDLLDTILLVADADLEKQLCAHPDRRASGTILEAKLDRTRGPVATVLIQNGTLRVGDPFIAGAVYGKVRAMFDDHGETLHEAGPATPVEVLGLASVAQAGDSFQVVSEEAKARQIGAFRQLKLREKSISKSARLSLQHLHERLSEGSVKELPIILKGDVQGSVEVLTKTLQDLSDDHVKIKIIHSAPGAITESDVLLASASGAIVIGFNVRPERKASDLSEKEGVDIRLHTVIYQVGDEIKKAMKGLLEPTIKEVYLGRAEVRKLFKVGKVGVIAGSYVTDGKLARNAQVRLLRDDVVVYKGRMASLKHIKDDVSEIKQGFECGILLERFNDLKTGDIVEAFRMETVEASV
ncbi:MAG: translation initiation factor IF-2 [Acidobacteria bacterium]|nr:translation initiation factor IF-2 [Acidobacteriota bacterium]